MQTQFNQKFAYHALTAWKLRSQPSQAIAHSNRIKFFS